MSDDLLSIVRDWVEKKTRPQTIQANRLPQELLSYWRQFSLISIENGLLTRKWVDLKDPSKDRTLILVPEALQENFMRASHNSPFTNHPGVKSSIEVCRRHYYWPKMGECFKLWVEACVTCSEAKPPHQYSKAPPAFVFS